MPDDWRYQKPRSPVRRLRWRLWFRRRMRLLARAQRHVRVAQARGFYLDTRIVAAVAELEDLRDRWA